MEQLSFWLKLLIWIIIIVITLYGVLKILIEKTPDLLLKILKKKQDDVYVPEWLVHERDEILRCKNKLRHDYGLTWGEIDNYIKESKEASKVFRRSYKAQRTFSEIGVLKNLIKIKESEINSEKDLEDENEDFKTKTQ